MEAQLLRTFVAVARLRSFSAAAAELGYTQAAVSQQIAALENDLKTQLLTRRPVTPTEPGARLLEHAEPILLRLDAAKADVTRMTKTPPDELDLALTDGLTAPGDPLPEQAPVTAIGLSEEQISVVLPAGHPLAARTTLRLEDLADARWIEAGNVAPPLAEIRRHAGVEGFRPALRYLGEDVMTLINLAAAATA